MSSPIAMMVGMACLPETIAGAKSAAKTQVAQTKFSETFFTDVQAIQTAMKNGDTKLAGYTDEEWAALKQAYHQAQQMSFMFGAMTSAGMITPYASDKVPVLTTNANLLQA